MNGVSIRIVRDPGNGILVATTDQDEDTVLAYAVRGYRARGSNWSGWIVRPAPGGVQVPDVGPVKNIGRAQTELRAMAHRIVKQTS